MRARLNLALYPAAARRRTTFLSVSSLLLAVALTAVHIVWASTDGSLPAEVRGEAELLARQAAVRQERVEELRRALEPGVLQDLGARVDLANELIARAAIDPVELLALVEVAAPQSLLVERLLVTGSPDGLRAELTVRVETQADALELIRRLREDQAIREVTPVREQIVDGGDLVVLSLLYRPVSVDDGGSE